MKTETKEYVIKNYYEGNSYGLYIKQLLVFLKKISNEDNEFKYGDFSTKIKKVKIGPSDMPFKKYDYLDDLFKMGCLKKVDDYIKIVDYIDEISDETPEFQMTIVEDRKIVKVRFSNNLNSKGSRYECEFDVEIGDRVYVSGKQSGKIGVVTEINVADDFSYQLQKITSIAE